MFGTAKYRLEVNKVLEGSSELIVIGGRATTYGDIKRVFIGEGVFSSFDTRQLGRIIRKEGSMFADSAGAIATSATASGPLKTAAAKVMDGLDYMTSSVVDDIGDAWAERERVGAAITLMESGMDARTASRLVVDGLYDYAQSMTKGDRSMLVSLLFPFWAFHKNANQQFICKNIHIIGRENKALKIPIAHGEGRFQADEATIQSIIDNDQIIYRYCDENGNITPEANPNGTLHNIAGICNKERNVFGMMPHPERACSGKIGNTDGVTVFNTLLLQHVKDAVTA
jgi:hypothetical protein